VCVCVCRVRLGVGWLSGEMGLLRSHEHTTKTLTDHKRQTKSHLTTQHRHRPANVVTYIYTHAPPRRLHSHGRPLLPHPLHAPPGLPLVLCYLCFFGMMVDDIPVRFISCVFVSQPYLHAPHDALQAEGGGLEHHKLPAEAAKNKQQQQQEQEQQQHNNEIQ
jgi:hypothetical protein